MKKRFSKQEIKIIKDFIHSIDSTLKVKISRELRFECNIERKIIYLGAKKPNHKENLLFQEWYKKQPEYTPINKTLMSILHEIGHFKTFNKQEFALRNEQEQMLTFMYEHYYIDEKQINFSYWSIDNERKATMWGVQFFKDNTPICNKLTKTLGLTH